MKAIITFVKPVNTTLDDIAAFIGDALSTWGGQFHPDDPLFHSLNLTEISVHGKRFLPRDASPVQPVTQLIDP